MKLPDHKTKIVCTIGPASRSVAVLKKLIRRGMNVARLNFSHGTFEEHRRDIQQIRSLAAQLGRAILILIDLPGPKIRVGKLQHEPMVLRGGKEVILTTKHVVDTVTRIPVNYPRLPRDVSKGSLIYLNDGFIQLRVLSVSKNEVRCKVLIGGQLLSHKGLSLPGAKMDTPAITKVDFDCVEYGLRSGVTSFSISFIEKADDILKIKKFAQKHGASVHVVAKIERAEALSNIDEIIGIADGIMVARGDLGVHIPIEGIPAVQKKIIRKANCAGVPVITATQMLESMTQNVRPTRAEVTDVANAILDGTDAVMLSEETAIGRYPVNAVDMMVKIARSIEDQRRDLASISDLEGYIKRSINDRNTNIEDVLSLSVVESLRALNARFVLTPTRSGRTARHIARFKPDCWNLAFCRDEKVRDFLALSYGVYPIFMKHKVGNWFDTMERFIKYHRLARKGDTMILTQGISGKIAGTNSLRVIRMH
ncbi:pyruvate kinase [candidate division WOR-1 bacterium DG_54_3]|uniref:Pyruvate kinase n=1 Tax=candidate division WOR-1 bacterium DG_54_3 TaxID=1703775 RepID=A0A0S7Y3G7_UNCSA|nr:MAG: pyruvate kinase [candidate division WOR-1 bacterium DG_54_3]